MVISYQRYIQNKSDKIEILKVACSSHLLLLSFSLTLLKIVITILIMMMMMRIIIIS